MQDFEDYIMFFVKCFAILFLVHYFMKIFISVIDLIFNKNKDLIPIVIFRMSLSFVFLLILKGDKYYWLAFDILLTLVMLLNLFVEDWRSVCYVLSKWKLKRKGLIRNQKLSDIIAPTKIKTPKETIPFYLQKCNNDTFVVTDPIKDFSIISGKYKITTIDLIDMKNSSSFSPYGLPYEYILKRVYALISECDCEVLKNISFFINNSTSLSEVQKKYLLNKIRSSLFTMTLKQIKRGRRNE